MRFVQRTTYAWGWLEVWYDVVEGQRFYFAVDSHNRYHWFDNLRAAEQWLGVHECVSVH